MFVRTKTPSVSLNGLMADMARFGVVFDKDGVQPPENVEGNDGNENENEELSPKKEDKKPAKKEKEPAKTENDAQAAKLKADLEAAQALLQKYNGVSPDDLTGLLALKKEKEDAERAAAEAARVAEEERLRQEGNFTALKERMVEEHQRELAAVKDSMESLQKQIATLNSALVEATVGAAFASSKYITDNTVFTPNKARKLYGEYFDVDEKGKVIGYDAPRGSEKRTPFVDGQGKVLSFEESMKRLVEADPEKDSILRSKSVPGSGLRPGNAKPEPAKKPELRGMARIRAGLENRS